MPPSPDSTGGADAALPADASDGVRPDARGADAAPAPTDASGSPDAAKPPGDAGGSGGDTGGSSGGSDAGGSGGSGIVSCYSEGNPGAMCTLPTRCCFNNYSAQHNGACSTDACTWGTIECDGPEDCASGQHCCAHAIVTLDSGVSGYQLACQASACGIAPANQELCHPTAASAAGTCSSPDSRCVTAFGNDSDLPPSLHICQ